MLKGTDPLLSGDLLKILDDMGHGDQLLLVDRNYPAAASGSESEGRSLEYGVIPRLDFYRRASAAYAVVHTLEDQPYGCFILHKGVIF